jgi:hypothetical protein
MMTLVLALLLAQDAPKPELIQLWPGQAPGETTPGGEDKMEKGGVVNVTRPTIAVYRPAKDKDTGAAIVVAPGGGYRMLAITHEGTDVASWLTSIGVTAVLLRYRVPRPARGCRRQASASGRPARVSIVRSKAHDWGVDPARIGFLGFSAGGHLTANVSTNYDKPRLRGDRRRRQGELPSRLRGAGLPRRHPRQAGQDEAARPDPRLEGYAAVVPRRFRPTTTVPRPARSCCIRRSARPACRPSCTSTPPAATATACGRWTSRAPRGRSAARSGCAPAAC